MKRAALVLLVAAVGGCTNGDDHVAGPPGDAGPRDGAGGPPVTYYGDVRPILAAHCVGCHVSGGIAPIVLDNYTAAHDAAALIERYTSERRMPPFLADNSGACQHFATNEWLSDAELATLAAWNAQGAPEGNPATPAPPVAVVPHLSGTDVHTIDVGFAYTPNAASSDDYHCFLVQAPMGGYVTGAEVHPGNARIVHHVIVYEPQDASAVTEAMALDAGQPGPGYTCFGGPGPQRATPIALWAPGGGAAITPSGTGMPIDGTRPLIIQVHYNLLSARPGDTDRSTIDLRIAASAIPGYFLPVADLDLVAPPRMSSTTHSTDFPFGAYYLSAAGVPSVVHVYAIGPHMHTLGTDIRVELLHTDGTSECMVHIPRWDFNWQRGYAYEHPIPITPTSMMRITCTWDTSSRDTTVHWGESTQDEMCLAFLYVSI